jgi:hypothetical protein
MVVYLNDYKTARSSVAATADRYDEELLCANWNPALGAVLSLTTCPTTSEPSPILPETFTDAGAEEFLRRVYALASQI